MAALEKWLQRPDLKVTPGDLVADVGFSLRKDAGGGGPVVSCAMMRQMLALDMALYLSEYPPMSDAADA